MKLDEKILRIVANAELMSERRAENKDLSEEVLLELQRLGETQRIVQIPGSEDYVEVRLKKQTKRTLDKTGLAEQAEVDKEDLTLLGVSELTKSGEITPQMIKDNTHVSYVTSAKAKRKKPRKGKNK